MTDTANKVRLSQWDALLLESLRALGWSDGELLSRVATGELPVDNSEFHFDYGQLKVLSESEPEVFRQSVTAGYQIKYNTIRGIRSWISVAFGKEAELELEEGKEAVEAALTAEEKNRLEEVLSYGWRIVPLQSRDEGAGRYRIEPNQR